MADICIMLEGQEDLTWERFSRFIEAAEHLGFAGLYRSDHLTGLNGHATRESLALWPSLTVVAERTERIRFGPMVCSVTFRHPAMLAKMAASVDVLSGGRLDLGIGAGWFPGEHEMFGIPYPRYGERLDRLEEAAVVIRSLRSGQPVSTEGPHYPLREAMDFPLPTSTAPSLVMGGKGERTLRVVARHATEWNFSYNTLEFFEEKSSELDDACREVGRDPGEIARSMMLPFAIGRTDAELAEHIAGHRETFGDLPSGASQWRESGFIVGSPAEIVEQIGERVEAGVSRFMLQQNALDDIDSLETLANEVLPHV